MSSENNNNILPISTTPNKEKTMDDDTPIQKPHHHHRFIYYLFPSLLLAICAIIIVILSFTVYKIREPTMRINSIHFDNLDLTKNLTVITDVSVRNPNVLTFKFHSSTTSLLYRKHEVGVAFGPPGTVKGHKVFRTNVTVEVITERMLNDEKFMDDVQRGSLGLQTCTLVGGRVKILGMFKRHVDVMMNCTVSVSIASQAILDQHCTQHMWI